MLTPPCNGDSAEATFRKYNPPHLASRVNILLCFFPVSMAAPCYPALLIPLYLFHSLSWSPQNSVLGLFFNFLLFLDDLKESHGFTYHLHSNDSNLYVQVVTLSSTAYSIPLLECLKSISNLRIKNKVPNLPTQMYSTLSFPLAFDGNCILSVNHAQVQSLTSLLLL